VQYLLAFLMPSFKWQLPAIVVIGPIWQAFFTLALAAAAQRFDCPDYEQQGAVQARQPKATY
jgi:hypothetical protein